MIDSVFLIESLREKHRNAPLLAERERYLTYLLQIGGHRAHVREIANMLLTVIQVLKLDSTRPVGMDEILQGCERLVNDSSPCRSRGLGLASRPRFRRAAVNWLRFRGALLTTPKQVPKFDSVLSDFLNAMHSPRGLAFETLKSYRRRISEFLNWLQTRCSELSHVRAIDIEEYLDAKRSHGLSRHSVAAHCSTLRTFFGYAEQQRWCMSGLQSSISSPRVPRVGENLSGPSWQHVRRLISSIGSLKSADLRAKAMCLLFAIYGLRSAEVTGLLLEDIDWRRGSITVRRAKRGKTQQFPLQSEVGEAIALYLEKARPKCPCRSLFVTLNPPYRPVLGHTMSAITSPRIKKVGIATGQFGPHALRRACATQLLRTGSSLKDIADFLGHSDLRSVGNYARFDPASLKRVSDFSLGGVL
jgi:site-specific recombinase XerD